jgi:undecaprenyl pyrophosphate phosphatase UppP
VAALVSGLVAIHVLLRYLRSHGLWPFAVYAFVLGGLVVVLSLI